MIIAGVDEVGRGCLAGPVVAAAVILNDSINSLNDSKKLSKRKRESAGFGGRQPPAEGGSAAARAGGAHSGDLSKLQVPLLHILSLPASCRAVMQYTAGKFAIAFFGR